ncbi:ABC transporter substrate-binding protein [Pseudonocardia sp. RS11V-5]|uniref:ABC transporter substrate-binding protein n=1 Tax=Pseudonocardia terrae TaxID=2905831 RepID=UPI001E4C5FBE|nr:ABC transporter substrate-binding protein [Pseudonocardia terrae]MCE3551114.1 ABC transporter substrate-binding protein [Pseudonocardia terrae]
MTRSGSRRRGRLWGAAVGAAASLVLAACGGGSGSGSGDATGDLVIGASLAMTGPNAAAGNARFGIQGRFDQVNEQGGIQGHKIVLKIGDDQLDPAVAPGVARTLVENDEVLGTGFAGSAVSASVVPYLTAQKVLAIPSNGSTDLIKDPGSTYRLFIPSYGDLAAHIVDYAVKDLGKTKIAVAYTPDAVGNPMLEGTRSELARLGMAPVAEVSFSAKATSAAAQAAQLKASGADFVVLNHVPAVASVLMQANEQIGYQPAYGSTFALAQPALTKIMGAQLDDRIYFATGYIDPDSDAAADFRKYVGAAGGDIHNTDVMTGWAAADTYVEVLKKAVADAGGNTPTRAQVLAATDDLVIDTPYVRGVHWTADNHAGMKQARITKLVGGQFQQVEDFTPVPGPTS